jgi:hypothetical protein
MLLFSQLRVRTNLRLHFSFSRPTDFPNYIFSLCSIFTLKNKALTTVSSRDFISGKFLYSIYRNSVNSEITDFHEKVLFQECLFNNGCLEVHICRLIPNQFFHAGSKISIYDLLMKNENKESSNFFHLNQLGNKTF